MCKSLPREFTWTFVIADTSHLLLGIDFLNRHQLLVDCSNLKLVDSVTRSAAHGQSLTQSLVQLVVNDHKALPPILTEILVKFPSLFTPKCVPISPIDSKVTHYIDTGNASPIYAKTRQISAEKFNAAKAEFPSLLKSRIIRPSKSPWSSPFHLVPKDEPNTYRACGDYRALNAITKPNRYPIPHYSQRVY
jgi:cleavage and polyadenylation specificity factor subunit 1